MLAPPDAQLGQVAHPAVVQNGNVIYFSHPIFSQYQTKAPRWCKQLFANALTRLLPEPLVRVQAPSSLLVMLNKQADLNRHVLHLLYYVPERRCEEFDVIEDVVPLFDIPVSVRMDSPVTAVTVVPEGEKLPYVIEDGRLNFVLPRMQGHCMVEIR